MAEKFFPRPEAHSMKWNELLPPLRRAVRDLLLRLDGAVQEVDRSLEGQKEAKSGEVTANCFLVYGERGTGKTTVLLSAREAVGKCDDGFFAAREAVGKYDDDSIDKAERKRQQEKKNDARSSAVNLNRRGIVWLDVLDLESLPLHANLLTTMLTRVRNALCSSGPEKNSRETVSILEEGAESARHKLNQLIKDATLMWEDVHEPDTRNIANRQIAAADIYSEYRVRFQDAMKTLSRELGRRSCGSDKDLPVVLPIDNIDRSTQHLYNIVKLARMVASPHLWLVMAGDREDVETFLERAYWKELICVGDGSAAAGKTSVGGEDEASVMARRQAAAASHKLLPPSHRVEVDLVDPIATLCFCASSMNESDKSDRVKSQTVYELLKKVKIPNFGNGHTINFVALFDAREYVEGVAEDGEGKQAVDPSKEARPDKGAPLPKPKKVRLTLAAWLGLRLPARRVLDLWQLAQWAEQDQDHAAEKIARTMLRNAIAESEMTSEMGQWLQNEIVTRNTDGATILNFREPNPSLTVTSLRALHFELRVASKILSTSSDINQRFAVRSTLSALGAVEFCLFHLNKRSAKKPGEDPVGFDEDGKKLPHLVAGWLCVLHDIVNWAPKSWLLGSFASGSYLRLIGISHEVVRIGGQRIRKDPKALSLWWPAPRWANFFAYDVFKMRWERFTAAVRAACAPHNHHYPAEHLPRVLAVGWVACVIDTFWLLLPRDWPGEPPKTQKPEAGLIEKLKTRKLMDATDIDVEEANVMTAAAYLYAQIVGDDFNRGRVFFFNQGVIFMRNWLEQKLPLLLSQSYVPMKDDCAKMRRVAIIRSLRNTGLAKHWEANWDFILADIESELAKLFSFDEKPSEDKSGSRQQIPSYLEPGLLGSFADMREFWQDSGGGGN